MTCSGGETLGVYREVCERGGTPSGQVCVRVHMHVYVIYHMREADIVLTYACVYILTYKGKRSTSDVTVQLSLLCF